MMKLFAEGQERTLTRKESQTAGEQIYTEKGGGTPLSEVS
jgi:hypothetical protein